MKIISLILSIGTMFIFSIHAWSNEVHQLHAGEWPSNFRAPSGDRYGWYWDANTWVDIKVQNLSFEKRVGVRWTVDNWSTTNETYAQFEHDLEPGYEQWGVDITPALVMSNCYWCSPPDAIFEYAVFYSDPSSGMIFWDNNNNNNYKLTLPGNR